MEEAIKHCEEIAELKYDEAKEANKYADECFACAAEHRQLAKWLKELKSVYDVIDNANDKNKIEIRYLRKIMSGEHI